MVAVLALHLYVLVLSPSFGCKGTPGGGLLQCSLCIKLIINGCLLQPKVAVSGANGYQLE